MKGLYLIFIALISLALGVISTQIEDVSIQVPIRQTKPAQCGNDCLFRFCKTNENFNFAPAGRKLVMRDPDSTVNPFICLTDGTAGRIFRVGEALIQEDEETRTPISQWSPDGLDPLLPKDFFGTGIIPSLRKSGLRRMATTPAQYQFLDNRCVILPVRAFQEIDPETGEKLGRKVVRGNRNCVSFQTIAPKMVVELFWQSSDDFDLEVLEPDGDILDRSHPRTEFGRFNNDNGIDACDPPRVHHEMAIYRMPATLEKGDYTISVTQFRNCQQGPTRYAVRVLIDGIKVFEEFGVSNAMSSRVVDSFTFTV